MQRSPPADQKENPDSLAGEIGVQGVEALPGRVERYAKAKSTALDVAEYMATVPGLQDMAKRVASCGDYLAFRHYFTVDLVRLHGAQLCMKSLLCPLCAIRRGAKALKSYLDRWECIRVEKPLLRPFLVTLTVKDGDDLAERFRHLHAGQRELWKRRQRRRGSVLDGVMGAVWSYEVKRGSGSGKWHPHLHMIALAEEQPDQDALSAEWLEITGDSFIVDVRPIDQADPVSGFLEVFKYAVKFSEQEPADTVEAFRVLKGRRLIGSAGVFLNVEMTPGLLDDESEALQELPFITLFYRYLSVSRGYSLTSRQSGQDSPTAKRRTGSGTSSRRASHGAAGELSTVEEEKLGKSEMVRRLIQERIESRASERQRLAELRQRFNLV
jgi:hypothetical protein